MKPKKINPNDYSKSGDDVSAAFLAWKKATPWLKGSHYAVAFVAGYNAAKNKNNN